MSKKSKKPKAQSKHPLPAITHFPSPIVTERSTLSREEKIEYIAVRFKEIMEMLDLDLSDASLAKTPYRVAKMYVNEVFSGLDYNNFPTISHIDNDFKYETHNHIVFMRVNFNSFCEHHFVPMVGTAYVAYVPHEKVIGLSKIPRIVRYFSRRPQVQERLSAQIADCLVTVLESEDVAVSIAAEHYCILARGIEDEESHAITNVLRGKFESDIELRKEFFEAINRKFE
jgi:GTP cyclohydrolase IA